MLGLEIRRIGEHDIDVAMCLVFDDCCPKESGRGARLAGFSHSATAKLSCIAAHPRRPRPYVQKLSVAGDHRRRREVDEPARAAAADASWTEADNERCAQSSGPL
jgi:hypothetical protein